MISAQTGEFLRRHSLATDFCGLAAFLGLALLFAPYTAWWLKMLLIPPLAVVVAALIGREWRHASPRTPVGLTLSVSKPAGRMGGPIWVDVVVPKGEWVVGLVGYTVQKDYERRSYSAGKRQVRTAPPRNGVVTAALIDMLSLGPQSIQWEQWTTLEVGASRLKLRVPKVKAPTQRSRSLHARWEVRVAKGTPERPKLTVGEVEPVLVLPS